MRDKKGNKTQEESGSKGEERRDRNVPEITQFVLWMITQLITPTLTTS